MRIRANNMDKSLRNQRFGEFLDLGTEVAGQTAGGNLQQATVLDELFYHFWLTDNSTVPFRVGEDSNQPGLGKLGQQPFDRQVHFVGQFEQHVPATVGKRDDLAAANFIHQARFDPHVRARQNAQRYFAPFEFALEARGRRADCLARVARVVPQLMRRGNDCIDAVLDGHSGHCQGFVQIGRAVVQTGQQVAVNVGEWLGRNHLCFSSSRAARPESSRPFNASRSLVSTLRFSGARRRHHFKCVSASVKASRFNRSTACQ